MTTVRERRLTIVISLLAGMLLGAMCILIALQLRDMRRAGRAVDRHVMCAEKINDRIDTVTLAPSDAQQAVIVHALDEYRDARRIARKQASE